MGISEIVDPDGDDRGAPFSYDREEDFIKGAAAAFEEVLPHL